VPCRLFFRPKKNGIAVVEGMPASDGMGPDGEERQTWVPYKLWRADLWVCKGCGAEIVVGFGNLPLAEHYEPTFKQRVEALAPLFQINDC
jgi:hypothetical protein